MKKRLKFFLLLTAVLLIVIPQAFGKSLGDINRDAKITIIDALMTAQYSIDIKIDVDPEAIVDMDVNCDGNINIVDALIIAQYAVGLITRFPCTAPDLDFNPGQTEFTDKELWDAVYTDLYSCPSFFPGEEFTGDQISYLTPYLTAPVGEIPERNYQFCTDSYNEAYRWAQAADERNEYIHSFLEQRETERYFEFTYAYTPSVGKDSTCRMRVHKLSYVDVTSYPLTDRVTFIGYLNFRPLDKERVLDVIEYLWLVHYLKLKGSKALSSSLSETEEAYIVHLYSTSVVYGDWNLYDEISLRRIEYQIDKTTGAINRRDTTIRTITGRYNPISIG